MMNIFAPDAMNPAYLILLVLVVIYVPAYLYVRKSPGLRERGLVPYGPMIMIRTRLGMRLMDRWSVYTRFWRFFGALSKLLSLFLMVVIVAIVILDIILLPNLLGRQGIGIEYALAIPGLNPMLPLVYGVIGLVIAMVIHEMAHGMQTRANGMRVESTGLLYAVVPVGAFVEPNEEDVKRASRRARMDLYSAGIATNLIAAMILFAAMAGGMMGSMTSDYWDNPAVYTVQADTPAYESGIPDTAVFLTIDGEEVRYIYSGGSGSFRTADGSQFELDPTRTSDITYLTDSGETLSVSVQMGVYISAITSDSPSKGILEKGMYICSLTADGTAYPVYDQHTFSGALAETRPGQTVTVTYAMSGEYGTTYDADVTLGRNGDIGYLGVESSLSGFGMVSPNIVQNLGKNPLYGVTSIQDAAYGALSYIGMAFKGFSPVPESVQWWYDVPGGEVFWVVLSVLYWTFWLNLVLGVTNALPAMPFDGGHLFRGGLDFLLEKLGMHDHDRRQVLTDSVSGALSMVMIMIMVLLIMVIVL